jgi:hypothetical protein
LWNPTAVAKDHTDLAGVHSFLGHLDDTVAYVLGANLAPAWWRTFVW